MYRANLSHFNRLSNQGVNHMTKILTTNEMLQIIHTFDEAMARALADEMKATADKAAAIICRRFKLHTGPHGASVEEPELGGTAAPFYRASAEIPVPKCFEYFDEGETIDVCAKPRKKSPMPHRFVGLEI